MTPGPFVARLEVSMRCRAAPDVWTIHDRSGPLSAFESSAVAQEMTERLLSEHPDLAGIYVAGGGNSGTLEALLAMLLGGLVE